VQDVLAFDTTKSPSRLAKLRNAFRELYGIKHPAMHVVERARKAKCRARRRAKQKNDLKGSFIARARCSVPTEELPDCWLKTLELLTSGQRVRGRSAAPSSVVSMRNSARQLIFSAKEQRIAGGFDLRSLRAYHKALEARGLRSSSIEIQFAALRRLAYSVGEEPDTLEMISDVIAHHRAKRLLARKRKEDKYARLPNLKDTFEIANWLLVSGSVEPHATKRNTMLTDAAALAFLSIIPLRNKNTVLRWGEHISILDRPIDNWIYRIDTKITKTLVDFGGKIHPILNPFIEALLLQGQHEAFLPRLRCEAIARRAPVFPTTTGQPRDAGSLSRRWAIHFDVGSHIARTRVHTILGQMGREGTLSALALCAQRSLQSRNEYLAETRNADLMQSSQEALGSMLPKDLIALRLQGV